MMQIVAGLVIGLFLAVVAMLMYFLKVVDQDKKHQKQIGNNHQDSTAVTFREFKE